jgi:endonuclease/exonuclease/phosphatase family metal-dependent hydrolase
MQVGYQPGQTDNFYLAYATDLPGKIDEVLETQNSKTPLDSTNSLQSTLPQPTVEQTIAEELERCRRNIAFAGTMTGEPSSLPSVHVKPLSNVCLGRVHDETYSVSGKRLNNDVVREGRENEEQCSSPPSTCQTPIVLFQSPFSAHRQASMQPIIGWLSTGSPPDKPYSDSLDVLQSSSGNTFTELPGNGCSIVPGAEAQLKGIDKGDIVINCDNFLCSPVHVTNRIWSQPCNDERISTRSPVKQRSRSARRDKKKIKNAAEQSSPSGRKFSKCVTYSIGNDYILVAKHHLMEIKLLVFVHKKHRRRIGNVSVMSEATGIGNVVGNKGAVAVKMELDGTSICFVSSHLGAHEGSKYLQNRNENVTEIMRSLEKSSWTGNIPSIHQFCHIVWMGDLNYRLDLQRTIPKATAWSFDEKWTHINDLTDKADYSSLLQSDELRCEMEKRSVFANWSEGEINFKPTFKVKRGQPVTTYQHLRLPAYCDRILWRSLPMHKKSLSLIKYAAMESYTTSDHKPVYAVFHLNLALPLRRYTNPVPKYALKCTIDFTSLRLTGLYETKSPCFGETSGLSYDVLEDGSLSPRFDSLCNFCETSYSDACEISKASCALPSHVTSVKLQTATSMSPSNSAMHTRRGVRVEFHGNGIFLRGKAYRMEVPLKNGQVREAAEHQLPKVPLIPLESLVDLMQRYVTIVFTRWGSKVATSCVLAIADLVTDIGRHKVNKQLELTKYGQTIAYVEVAAELCISFECWIDSHNNVIKARGHL